MLLFFLRPFSRCCVFIVFNYSLTLKTKEKWKTRVQHRTIAATQFRMIAAAQTVTIAAIQTQTVVVAIQHPAAVALLQVVAQEHVVVNLHKKQNRQYLFCFLVFSSYFPVVQSAIIFKKWQYLRPRSHTTGISQCFHKCYNIIDLVLFQTKAVKR